MKHSTSASKASIGKHGAQGRGRLKLEDEKGKLRTTEDN